MRIARPPIRPGWRRLWNPSNDLLVDTSMYPRCRLCNFKFEDGDNIIAVSEYGRHSPIITYTSDVRVTGATLLDMFSGFSFPHLENESELVGCHIGCVEFAFGQIEGSVQYPRAGIQHSLSLQPARGQLITVSMARELTSKAFSMAMTALCGDHEPFMPVRDPPELPKMLVDRMFGGDRRSWQRAISHEDHQRRARDIRDELVFNISRKMDPTRKIPTEIWEMIASHLTKLYATMTVVEPLPREDSTVTRDICDIWATYAKIDGKIYLAKLSNEASMGAIMLHRRQPQGKMTETKLFIKKDHVGIRNIFLCKTAPPFTTTPDDPTQWKVYPLEKKDIRLTFSSDGFVLKRFVPDAHERRSAAFLAMERLFGGMIPELFR